MKGALKKTAYGFVPADAEAQKMFDKMAIGALCMGEYLKKRNPENHGRFFAFRNTSFEMQDSFTDEEVWRKQLLILAGHFEMVIRPKPDWWARAMKYLSKWLGGPQKGSLIEKIDSAMGAQYEAKSMAFEKMDEAEFQELFKRCVTAFLENYGNGMTEEELLRIIRFD